MALVSPLSSPSLSLHLSAHLECFLCVSFVCSSSSSSTLPFVFVPHCLLALFLLFFNNFSQAVFVSFVCVCPGRVPGLEYRTRNLFFPCVICSLVQKTGVAQGANIHKFTTSTLTVGILSTQVWCVTEEPLWFISQLPVRSRM